MDDVNLKCYLRNKTFILYGSVFAFVIPIITMKLMFSLTVRKLRLQMKKLECSTSNNNTQQNSKHTEQESEVSNESKLLTSTSMYSIKKFNSKSEKVNTHDPRKTNVHVQLRRHKSSTV